ncbi:MAG: V-type ATPase subunit [Candidatus Wallbacteria bacterium]|nr:V-type ATPase subunit [Candidatus Wallbacteria bacterium]
MVNELDFHCISNEESWVFPATSAKVLEKKLLSQQQVDSLLSAVNRHQFLALLAETRYSNYTDGNAIDIWRLYWQETDELHSIFSKLLPEQFRGMNVIFLQVDLGFLKTAWRRFRNGQDPLTDDFHFYVLPVLELKHGFAKGSFRNLSGLENMLNQALIQELPEIDSMLDAYLADTFALFIKEFKSPLLSATYQLEIDINNLRSVLRRKLMEQSGMPLKKDLYFRAGGRIPAETLQRALDESVEYLFTHLPAPYDDFVAKTWEAFVKTGNFLALDTGFHNMAVELLKNVRYYLLRPDNLAAYALAVMRELNLVRRAYLLANNEIEMQRDKELTYAA